MILTKTKTITKLAADFFIITGAFGLLLMTAIVGWKVFGRYVLDSTPNWAEQLALVLMIWYVSFAAAAGVREGFHIRIVALENIFPGKIKMLIRLFSHSVVGICGFAMLLWGSQLVIGTWSHAVPTLGIPRGAVYMALPIAGAIITLFSVENIAEEIERSQSTEQENSQWN